MTQTRSGERTRADAQCHSAGDLEDTTALSVCAERVRCRYPGDDQHNLRAEILDAAMRCELRLPHRFEMALFHHVR